VEDAAPGSFLTFEERRAAVRKEVAAGRLSRVQTRTLLRVSEVSTRVDSNCRAGAAGTTRFEVPTGLRVTTILSYGDLVA